MRRPSPDVLPEARPLGMEDTSPVVRLAPSQCVTARIAR